MCTDIIDESSSNAPAQNIPAFYSGKSVFITGATGFVGKALMEKLLRSCPGLATIYVLMRPKRGKHLAERLAGLLDDPLYERLKKEQPDLVLEKKIVPLAGDMLQLNLGLCDEDRKFLTENAQVIFHVAATVRFDEPLKNAVLLNVRGTREVCQLALDCKKLEAYVHVSTAFANCDRSEVSEILYPPKASWKQTIEIAEKFDNDILSVLSEKYIGTFPNTYCFTKNLAEHVVHDMCNGKIPTKISRPSIVVGTMREEPIVGWLDNFNGPLGIIVAYGKGIMNTMYVNQQCKPDYIPVDVVTKSLAVGAWDVAQRGPGAAPQIVQCTSHRALWLRPSHAHLTQIGVTALHETPFNDTLWLPQAHTTSSPAECYVRTVLFMLLPAFLCDVLLKITGRKPKLLRLQKKMYIVQLALRHFINNEWEFSNDNLLQLQARIPADDKPDWDYEFMDFDLELYLRQSVLGLRRYLLNEPDHTLPAAKKHYRRMYWVNRVWQLFFWGCLLLVVSKIGIVQQAVKLIC